VDCFRYLFHRLLIYVDVYVLAVDWQKMMKQQIQKKRRRREKNIHRVSHLKEAKLNKNYDVSINKNKLRYLQWGLWLRGSMMRQSILVNGSVMEGIINFLAGNLGVRKGNACLTKMTEEKTAKRTSNVVFGCFLSSSEYSTKKEERLFQFGASTTFFTFDLFLF
jgi:hypothetical protein